MKNLYKFKTTLVLILLVMAGGMVMGQTPTVSTDNIYNISTDRARVAYTAAPNGATITEKGVCYSNTVNPPTTSNSKVTDGSLNDTSSVILSSLTPSQTYYVRAYAIYNGGVSTQYGDVIAFYTGTTFSVTYNCDIKNDVLNTSSEYQFDVWIYRTGDNALNLNNYQLGMEMSRLDLLGNEFMTGEYVAGTCQLGAGFEPSGMTIAKQLAGGGHAYDHMDVRINGLVPSSNSVLVGTSPGLRIGTFKLKNWTNGSYNVAKSFGAVQPDLGWDNDFIARTYIYAMISGVRTIITNINNHYYPTKI